MRRKTVNNARTRSLRRTINLTRQLLTSVTARSSSFLGDVLADRAASSRTATRPSRLHLTLNVLRRHRSSTLIKTRNNVHVDRHQTLTSRHQPNRSASTSRCNSCASTEAFAFSNRSTGSSKANGSYAALRLLDAWNDALNRAISLYVSAAINSDSDQRPPRTARATAPLTGAKSTYNSRTRSSALSTNRTPNRSSNSKLDNLP
ncbi:hypothetical protein Henu3_gp75 [Mycobacterium phage Henu3 PeY-2017]|nr:hypothetical protein Henu3_gp75 [Mycobacterium phage Henu3 PeY-2017]